MPSQSYGQSIGERLRHPVTQFQEALNSFAKQVRVAVPAIVKSFDASKQTVTVLPAIREEERVGGVLQSLPLPELQDVPVVFPRGGDFLMTFPIQAGDECLVVFSDTCIDSWFQSGGQQNESKRRRHSIADGFAIFGPWNQQRAIDNYSTDAVEIRTVSGSTKVSIEDTNITVTATSTVHVSAQTANVEASGTATVQGATVNVTGSSAVHISGSGSTTIEGKDWLTHKHLGVQTGAGVSGIVL